MSPSRARMYKWDQEFCHWITWSCLCSLSHETWAVPACAERPGMYPVPWTLQRPHSSAWRAPVPPWSLKLKGALQSHWFLAQTPILRNSIHPPSHLEGISHFEWINFIRLLPSTTMLLIHAPLQPVRRGQVHWAALSQTYLLVSHPLEIPLPLSVDYRWIPTAHFIWNS